MAESFKLQNVLNHRQRLENLAQQKLADSLRRETELQKQLAAARAELEKTRQELGSLQRSGITAQELLLFNGSINRQRKNLKALLEQAVRHRREVSDNRELLAATTREKKLLENLKEKKEAENQVLNRRRESATLDELALRLGKYSP